MEVSAIALKLTGLELSTARFQALSALTGTGFTTRDAEHVVRNPIRRRIIMALMVIGHVGLAVIVISLFGTISNQIAWWHIVVFAVLVILLYAIITDRWLISKLDQQIERSLARGALLRKRPVEEVLRLGDDHAVAEIVLGKDAAVVGKALSETDLRARDLLVLAIQRQAEVVHAPHASEILQEEDILIVYGPVQSLAEIATHQGEKFNI